MTHTTLNEDGSVTFLALPYFDVDTSLIDAPDGFELVEVTVTKEHAVLLLSRFEFLRFLRTKDKEAYRIQFHDFDCILDSFYADWDAAPLDPDGEIFPKRDWEVVSKEEGRLARMPRIENETCTILKRAGEEFAVSWSCDERYSNIGVSIPSISEETIRQIAEGTFKG